MDGSEVSSYLQVGVVVLFHTPRQSKSGRKIRSTIRGWRPGSHIMLDRPTDETGHVAAVQEHETCTLRYVIGGYAVAFEARVLDWESRRDNACLRISWPTEIETSRFRRFERVDAKIPCNVQLAGQVLGGVAQDLSIGGAGVHLEKECIIGQHATLELELPNGVYIDGVKSIVRSCRKGTEGYLVGFEFETGSEAEQSDIAFFITSVQSLLRGKGQSRAETRLLLVEPDPKLRARLVRRFRREGQTVVAVPTAVDAFHRMRLFIPACAMINHTTADLDGLSMCKVIRKHPQYDDTPLVLYGSEPAEFSERAVAAGATAYVPTSEDLAGDLLDIAGGK